MDDSSGVGMDRSDKLEIMGGYTSTETSIPEEDTRYEKKFESSRQVFFYLGLQHQTFEMCSICCSVKFC
jgi:hypothetical protein